MLKALRIIPSVFLLLATAPTLFAQIIPPPVNAPLAFEINRGQTAPQVRYLARSREGVVFLTPDGITIALPHAGSFRLLFDNVASAAVIIAEQPLAARSNYLSHGPEHSIASVENFAALRYQSAYPGIDVRFYGRGQHLEHDFLLAPGADVRQIALRLQGIDHAAVTPSGAVELTLGRHRLYESAPVAWQTVNGRRQPVQAEWKLLSDNRLGIDLGKYDHNLPLTIDPVLAYSTHLGGTTAEDISLGQSFPADTRIEQVALDAAGNVYVSGTTSAIDFPTTAGAFDRIFNVQGSFHSDEMSQSGFVSKFDKTGRILLYSTFLHNDIPFMTVDSAGHAYTAEFANDANPGPNFGSDSGIFVDKLSPDGSTLVYEFIFGRSTSNTTQCQTVSDSFPNGIAADNSGHVWISGSTSNPCIPTTPGVVEPTLATNDIAGFLAKIDTNKAGTASIMYVTYVGSSSQARPTALTVDSSGNAYVVGITDSTYPHSHSFGSGPAFFVTKFNPAASARIFSTLLLGVDGLASGIAIDPSRNVYVAGNTDSSGFPTTPGAFKRTLTGPNCAGPATAACPDGFVTKLNATGSALIYSTLLGGMAPEVINGLKVNSAGMAFVTGVTNSPDFPVTTNGFGKPTPTGGSDAFVTALQPNGQSLYYSAVLGGSSSQNPSFGNAIFVDPAWNAWVGGTTAATDFPVTPDAFQPGRNGASDGFFAKIVIAGDLRATMTANAPFATRNTIVTFFARVTNLGPDGSDNVLLSDPIPSGYSFVKVFSNSVTSCSTPAVGATTGTITCKRTRLEKGQTVFLNVYLKAIGATGSSHANKLTASAQTQDLAPANNSATVSVSVK